MKEQLATKAHTTWRPDIYVCIPSYKAATMLKEFLPSLLQLVPSENVLVIDDASADSTSQVAGTLGIACARHEINRGKGQALKTGFDITLKKGANWIVTMDADGQHSVEDLPNFLEAINRYPQAGIILGSRKRVPGSMPLLRIFSNTTTSAIISLLCAQRIEDSQCGFRAYNANLLRFISLEYSRFEMESEVILKARFAGFNIYNLPVQTIYTNQGSHISHFHDTLRWIGAVIHIWLGQYRMANNPESRDK